MSRALLTLRSATDRHKAKAWVDGAPFGTRVEFKASKRSLPQNDRMWAMLTDVATQIQHHGMKLTPDDWKLLFMDALNREMRAVPNLDGTGFVNLGTRSSDLSKGEMSDLIELIAEYGARHGVVFHDRETEAA